MPMIDLDTGSLTDEEVGVFPPEPIQQDLPPASGGIINLDTGAFESAAPAIQTAQPVQEEPGFFDIFTGESRETEATRTLPEIGALSTDDIGKDFRVAAGLLSAVEPQDQMDVIKSVVPEAKFEQDEKGNIIVDLGEGKTGKIESVGLLHTTFASAEGKVMKPNAWAMQQYYGWS